MEELLSINETAAFLKISRDTVIREIQRGNLRAIKAGRQYRIRKTDLLSYVTNYLYQTKE